LEEQSNVLFSILGLAVTKSVVTTWVIMLILVLFSILATRSLRDVPGPLQNLAEMAVEKLEGFFADIMGYQPMRRYFPVFATLFLFIVASNYSGLFPGAGHLFSVPTASLSVTGGLAVISFFTTFFAGSAALRQPLRGRTGDRAVGSHVPCFAATGDAGAESAVLSDPSHGVYHAARNFCKRSNRGRRVIGSKEK